MLVNYKFQIQVKLRYLTFYLDKSVDIELSTFENLGSLPFLSNYLLTVKDLYFAYFSYDSSLLADSLDRQDLAFLSFLEDIKSVNFNDVVFNGDYVPVLGSHGKDYDYVLYVNEG